MGCAAEVHVDAGPFFQQLRMFDDRYAGGLGERGSQEAMAGLFRRVGYRARVEGCVCHTNAALLWFLHAWLLVLGALAAALHPLPGMTLTLLALASLHGEVARRGRLVRWFVPKGISSNLIARDERDGDDDTPRVLFVAHGDVARRGLIHSRLLGLATRGATGPFKVHAVHVALALGWFQAAVVGLRATGLPLDVLDRVLLAPLALFGLLMLLALDWMRPRAAGGAHDNGSGLAVLSALAEHFAETPARHAEVDFLVTGAREAGSGGMDAFLTTFGRTLPQETTFVINIDDVGAGRLCYAVGERTPQPLGYHPLLPGMAAALARRSSHAGVRPVTLLGLGDAGVATLHGYAAVTLKCLRRGRPPVPVHTRRDRTGRLDPDVIEDAYRFAVALVERIDAELGEEATRSVDPELVDEPRGRKAASS